MNKINLLAVILVGLFLSCNNSQTPPNEQTLNSEEPSQTVETTAAVDTKNAKDTLNQELVKENKATISWAEFYKQFEKKSQTFTINCSKDTLLTCMEGTTLRIYSNSFITEKTRKPVSGTIKIKVKEFYKLSDILLANLTTTANNAMLETGGMLHITAVANNENCIIKENHAIEIAFPTKTKKEEMQLFTGAWNNNQVNWQLLPNATNANNVVLPDVEPQFPGGDQKMKEFISKNIRYPSRAMNLGIQGKVFIRMTIDKEGQVKDATVIRGIDPECDQEALNTVLKFPKFVPAQANGENVNSSFTLPIIFKLDGDIENRRDIKKHFEKTFSDSTIHQAGANYISSYVFSTNKLGWINCDRFINEKEERTDLWVALEKNEDSDVKMVFHRIKAILPSKTVNGKHLFNRIPKAEKITIVAIKKIDNIPYLAVKETFTSEQTVSDFTFKPITMESLKLEMRKLDGLHK